MRYFPYIKRIYDHLSNMLVDSEKLSDNSDDLLVNSNTLTSNSTTLVNNSNTIVSNSNSLVEDINTLVANSIENQTKAALDYKFQIDNTGCLTTIDISHYNIHRGEAFNFFAKQSIVNAQSYYIGLITPATKYIHLTPAHLITNGDNFDLDIYEGSEFTGGNAATIINHNRVSSPSLGITAFLAPTVSQEGSLIDKTFSGGGSGTPQTTFGNSVSNDKEFILKQSTKYLFKITNNGTATKSAFIKIFGYEEDYGN